ncbi:type II secretion system protein GspM [Xanthomonas nasturtii]|uniref:type II secretion system protein GspM n=1 Tax=Xanthomonas nasturtii TaxID=1843581 RepID=UPI0020111A4E|nr:type II secretion system protein GspM [Xanthomonas nasturtii]MCL1558623.1 type II secretion system protein M [Xanthomonas nasturtii]
MSSLPQRTHDWWQARAPRERIMLSVMLIAVAAFVAWYLVGGAMRHWRTAAQARYDVAAEQLLHARALQRDSVTAAVPRARVLRSAHEAGILIVTPSPGAPGTLELQIDAVTSTVLFSWLEQLRQRDNLAPSALDITRRDGQLQVRCTFAGIAP